MRKSIASFFAGVALVACSDSTGPGELTVDFQISAEHIHALETNVTYTVLVTDPENRTVTDFTTIAVEYAHDGTNDWAQVPLALQAGGAYQGTHQFTGPGEYDLRVVGARPGTAEAVLHQVSEPIEVIRPHFDAGGYRVEFQLEPEDLRPSVNLSLQFLVVEDVPADASGNRPPITGLAGVTIVCAEANGQTTTHDVTEEPAGVYRASHTFQAAGSVSATLHFTGDDEQPAEVTMPLTLSP